MLRHFWPSDSLQRQTRGAPGGRILLAVCAVAWLVTSTGCTPWREYFRNGFKVGPDYRMPAAPVADEWEDAADPNIKAGETVLNEWWNVFNDPVLNNLVRNAYGQNLDLRNAGMRILEYQAQLGYSIGTLGPQTQAQTMSYQRLQVSKASRNTSFFPFRALDQWSIGGNIAWELDFWGRFRRGIENASANLDQQVENYDSVLVLLLASTADAYVQLRTAEQRLAYARENAAIQEGSLKFAEERWKAGAASELDYQQARSNLARTMATIPDFEVNRRTSNNRLCVLMGMPPQDLAPMLGPPAAIPTPPPEVVLGIPAELLLRRPDVRRAERAVAAQSALIGVAEAEFYPHISITGNMQLFTQDFPNLFTQQAFAGQVGPTFSWNLLNYGRILNNVRVQDARFQQLALTYQQAVLNANEEAENALVTYLQAQQAVKILRVSVEAALRSVEIVTIEYKFGKSDFNRVYNLQLLLTQEQDRLALAESAAARGLIQVYKALGGGWQLRLEPRNQGGMNAGVTPELTPAPNPDMAPPPPPIPESEKAKELEKKTDGADAKNGVEKIGAEKTETPKQDDAKKEIK